MEPCAVLLPKREEPIKAGHPWIFSKALAKTERAERGSIVRILDSSDNFVGKGSYHPGNSIRIRVFTREDETIDSGFFKKRLSGLLEFKRSFLKPDTDGFRLVHGDADSLPGLIVDVYGKAAVFQIHTAGMDSFRKEITAALIEILNPSCLAERSDVESRRDDSLQPKKPEIVFGKLDGDAPFREEGMLFLADILKGQKTGFFLDQRETREALRGLSKDRRVLNLFSYTGAFGIAAAYGGAREVINVDVSGPALEKAKEMVSVNGFSSNSGMFSFVKKDVFEFLGGNTASFDCVVCDPPAFAKKRDQLSEAAKAYIRLNRMCLAGLSGGSVFITSSCSGIVSMEEFIQFIRIAAGQSGRELIVLKTLNQPPDHTRLLSFPEGGYLKSLICLVKGVL